MTVEDMRNSFDSIVTNLGKVKVNSNTPFSFKYIGTVPIHSISPSCGCTSVGVEEGAVVGTFNASSNPGVIDKKITVYFDDGEDMHIISDKKVSTLNPKKAKLTLSIVGETVE